jgi:Multiubiquitin
MPQFEIFVNNKPYSTGEHQLSARQIKALAGVPENYELFLEEGKESKPVGPEQVVHIHQHQHFRAIPPGTFGDLIATAQA